MIYVRRPGLGASLPVDKTAGKPGGTEILLPGYPCPIRYLADGTAQSRGTVQSGLKTSSCRPIMSGNRLATGDAAWTNLDMSKPIQGLKRWVDGIELDYNSVAPLKGGAGIGWRLTPESQVEFSNRAKAMRDAGGAAIYAPLPSGVYQTQVFDPMHDDLTDPVVMRYAIAKSASNQHAPSEVYRIYDPFTWNGYQAMPDGFLEPQDGGTWVLASDNVLDGAQKLFGIMKDPWYWMVATHPTTGQQRLFLAKRDYSQDNIFTRLGKTGPLVISILGTVLAPFTLGLSAAAAAVIDTTIAIEQKKAAAAAAARANQHGADVMQQQVNDQTVQVSNQADDVYHANQTAFLAAGYTDDKWAALTLDQKAALIQQAAAGKLQPTPEAVAVVQQTQQALDQAVQAASVQASLGVATPNGTPSSSGTGWLLALLGGGAALAIASGGKK